MIIVTDSLRASIQPRTNHHMFGNNNGNNNGTSTLWHQPKLNDDNDDEGPRTGTMSPRQNLNARDRYESRASFFFFFFFFLLFENYYLQIDYGLIPPPDHITTT